MEEQRLSRRAPVLMTPSNLIIVADRGSVKAYKVNDAAGRGPSLQLANAFDVMDAHGRYRDKVSDQAARFPVGDGGGAAGSGRHQNAVAERQGMEDETDRRIHRQIADSISQVVQQEAAVGWSFAAPASIHAAIVGLLPADVTGRIVEHVKADLVNIKPAELISHFRSLQPI